MDPPAGANDGCVGPTAETAGKASACAGCPSQNDCSSGKFRDQAAIDAEEVRERLESVKHKILVLSGKGGVGKSSVACQLAWTLASHGKQVGVLDIDICGPSCPRMLGVEDHDVHKSNSGWSPVYAADNLAVMSVGFMLGSKDDAVIWRGPRKNGLIKQFLTDVCWDDLDFLLVDAPPGTSDEHISIAKLLQHANPEGALIVTTPQQVALLDVRKEITFCKKVGMPILGVVENMSGFKCPCCDTTSDIFGSAAQSVRTMCDEMGVRYLGALPLDPELLRTCERGTCFTAANPDSTTSKAIHGLLHNVMQTSKKMQHTFNSNSD